MNSTFVFPLVIHQDSFCFSDCFKISIHSFEYLVPTEIFGQIRAERLYWIFLIALVATQPTRRLWKLMDDEPWLE